MASRYRLIHDPADPRCMTEEAMGWEHDSHHDGHIEMTPDQEAICNQAADLFEEIHDNHRKCRPARNEMESRIYAELDLDAEQEELDLKRALDEDYRQQVYAYYYDGLQAVSPQWLATADGRNFLAEIGQAPRAEPEAELEAGA